MLDLIEVAMEKEPMCQLEHFERVFDDEYLVPSPLVQAKNARITKRYVISQIVTIQLPL